MDATPEGRAGSQGGSILLTLAAFVVVCAGVSAASQIVIPVLAALFITTVALPPIIALQRRGAPLWLAGTLVLVVVLVGLLITGAIAAAAVANFRAELPTYTIALEAKFSAVDAWLRSHGIESSQVNLATLANPTQIMGFLGTTLGALVGIIRDGAFVFLVTVFLIAEAAGMPAKLRAAFSIDQGAMGPWSRVLDDMTTYLVVKTCTSFITAVLVATSLWFLGVPFPLALGLLAFLLNFVPVFGAVLAGIPAILLALILGTPTTAILAATIYTVINVVIGSVVEPKWMGQRLGLSTLVVFLSLVFWGFLLGPVGMLLAVPLTMLAKILLDHTNDLKWLSVLLGPTPRDPGP